MPNKSIPKRSEWQTLKKKHGIPDGAVSGINVGKELDAYWNGLQGSSPSGIKANIALAEALEKKLASYLQKLDKKKIKKDPSAFSKTFLDGYVALAFYMKEDFKRYNADREVYAKELTKFFTMVQKLVPGKTTVKELLDFRGGPVRGLTALGKSVKGGYNLKPIDDLAGVMSDTIQKFGDETPAPMVKTFVENVHVAAGRMAKHAKDIGIL